MLKITYFSAFPMMAFAGFETMFSSLNSLGNDTQFDRSVTQIMGPVMNRINKYGCWCYFDNDHGKGKGHPVDEVDEFCKVLHEGYECAILDAEEAGEDPCVPWEVDYDSTTTELDNIPSMCTQRNSDKSNCAINSCIVEQNFITLVFQSFLGGNQHTDTNLHNNGFDVDAECPTKKGAASEHSCCGYYPERHPYKTYGGTRSCCGKKTYDNSILTCCGDDKVRMTC